MIRKQSEVVVVTGATAGVGRATVREFARRKCAIGLIARDEDRLEATKREIESAGGRALICPVDVADAAAVEAAAARVEQELGPIDIWVNCAMTTIFAPFSQIEPHEFKRATEVTYLGFVYGTMAALKRMQTRDRGTIVQVSSALAYRSIPLQSPYCGAKHAITGFTDSLRSELIHSRSKIHLTAVNLPAINTPQFSWCRTQLPKHPQPVPPIFEPEVAAKAIYYAAHHRRREITVGASALQAMFAQKIAPGFADWYLGEAGYKAQQSGGNVRPNRPDNLYKPVPGPYAARGVFTGRATRMSWQLWFNLNRARVVAAIGLVAAGAYGWTTFAHKNSVEGSSQRRIQITR